MTDITKCTTDECPLADDCRRKLAPDGEWQSWAEFKWVEWPPNAGARTRTVSCKHFVETSK